MPNQFCRYLSNGFSFSQKNSDIIVKPCCWFKHSVPLDSQFADNYKKTFDSINGWTDACSACKSLENAGQQSLRQTGPDWIHNDVPHGDPVCIDINLDFTCNAACITCNEDISSLWKIENAKLQGKKIKIKNHDDTVDKSISKILESVSLNQVTYVKFFGGEPLLTDTHYKFIQNLPNPNLVTLHYTTNASIYPNNKIINEWKKFKCIIFSASLDGIQKQFDYVRWPLTWNKVSQNLIRLKQITDNSNVLFRVEFTANLLNIYYYDLLEKWIQENLSHNSAGDKTEINIHHCWGIFSPDSMPVPLREFIKTKYDHTHVIHQLVANLPAPISKTPWLNFAKIWDDRRNISWKKAFPELVDFIA
jgi:sulfatase maturation enzyme AslB (radical SAM superfamily)